MRRLTRTAILASGLLAAVDGVTPGELGAAGSRRAYLLTFDYSYDEHSTEPLVPEISYTHRGRCSGSVELAEAGTDLTGATAYTGGGQCGGFSYFRQTFTYPDVTAYQESDCAGTADSPPGFEGLLVVRENGTYDLTPPSAIWPGTARYLDGSTAAATRSPDAIPRLLNERRPVPGNPVITYSGTVVQEHVPGVNFSIHFTATLTPIGPPPKLVLEQTDKTVLPEVGQTISGKVTRVGTSGTPVPIRFLLEEVTNEPGVCLNGADAATAPDLDFASPANLLFKPPVAAGSSGWILETLVPSVGATCEIAVRDYGAWGKLRAEARYDGSWHPIPVRRTREGFTTVPFDKNRNKIADKWEKDERLRSADGGGDLEKKPAGDKTTVGDGFSNYEEYRGIFSRAVHRRMKPGVKELVVENAMGAPGESGLALFEGISGFPVIRLDPGELPQDRIVNAQKGLFHNGDQHGLRLVDEALGGGVAGEAVPAAVHGKRPKDCTRVRIDQSAIVSHYPAGEGGAEVSVTIAHEVAHCIGVEHHGDPVEVTANRDVTPLDTLTTLIGADGVRIPIPAEGYHVSGALNGPHDDASGDVACVMCYTDVYQWCVVPPTGPDFTFYAAQPRVTGTRFCKNAKGTGFNAGGRYFGDAARGNCLGQMRVRDY